MRFIVLGLTGLLAGSAVAADLSKFGGQITGMQSTTVQKSVLTKKQASAVETLEGTDDSYDPDTNNATDTTSGSDSASVSLGTSRSIPSDTKATVVDENSGDTKVAKPEPAPYVPLPTAPNTMPQVPGDVSTPPVEDPSLPVQPKPAAPKYVYKGEGNVTVPKMLVKDPRIDDGYVYEMFGRNKLK